MSVDTWNDMNGTNQTMWANYQPAPTVYPSQEVQQTETGATSLVIYTAAVTDTFGSFTLTTYGQGVIEEEEDRKSVEEQRRAFQDEGFCLVVYMGGTNQDWQNFASGGRQNCKGIAEFMRYTSDGSGGATGLTLQRIANNGGAQSAPEREADYEVLLGWQHTGEVPLGPVSAPIIIIPISVSMTQAGEDDYLNPVNDDEKDW